MKLTDTVTVINIVDEDLEQIQCTKVSQVHIEKVNQQVLNGVQISDNDSLVVYFSTKKSKATRLMVSANEFTAHPEADTYSFRKGDYIAVGDVNITSFTELNEGKQKLGNIYEISSVAEYLFGHLSNIQVTAN